MDFATRVRLDRYAIKNPDQKLQVDDLVVVSLERVFEREKRPVESREVGHVTRIGETYSVKLIGSDEVVENLPRHKLEYIVEKTYDEICERVAVAVAKLEPEDKQAQFSEQVKAAMVAERFVPAGRILSGLGRDDLDLTLFNCFVFAISSDSRTGISQHWGRLFETYSRGGGVGTPLSILRPKGSVVKKVNGRSSGSVSWAEQFSQITGATEQGGSRKGAAMLSQWCWHPDIIEFIEIKAQREEIEAPDGQTISRNRNWIKNANVSVMITNDFMQAVENNGDYQLVFPDTEDPDYDEKWNGNIWDWTDKLGKKAKVYQTVRARELWDLIVKHAWAAGEPGIIFMGRAEGLSNSYYYAPLIGSNPCNEEILPANGVCNLAHLNLSRYTRLNGWCVAERTGCGLDGNEAADFFDWTQFQNDIRMGVRFLDNVIDLNKYHDEDIEAQQLSERRIGLGLLGYGEMLMRLGMRYGSKYALEFTDHLMRVFSTTSYRASVDLAAERGVFPAFDLDKFLESGFMKQQDETVRAAIKQHGMRNVTVNTIAPTGSTSVLMKTTGGCEPFFDLEYTSTTRIGVVKEKATIVEQLTTEFGEDREEWPDYVVTAQKGITPEEHVRTQATMQRWIDASISKCIAAGTLIPTDKGLIPVEAFADAHKIDTFASTNGEFRTGGHRILSHYRAGQKTATRVRLDNGAELVGATESHRVLTPKGWLRIADLKSGDIVVGRFQESHSRGGMPLEWTDSLRTNANAVETPKYMTPAFAQFLGMIAADGSTLESTGHVGITCKNDHVAATFRKTCQEVFRIAPKETIDARNGVLSLYLTSRNLVRFVESLIGKGAYNKHAPIAVLQGNYDEKLAFLTGVTLDGYATPQGLVVYEGMSKDLAYHTAEIARSFGVPRVNQGRKWVAPSKAYAYSAMVSNELQEIIIPIEPHKRRAVTYKRFKVLADVHKIERSQFCSHSTKYHTLKSAQYRDQSFVLNTVAKAFGIPADVPVHRVTEVEDAGTVELYDVEVEDAHEYVVNGMVSHNTTNLPKDATVKDVADTYMLMWKLGCKGGTVYRDGSRDEQVLYVDEPVEVEVVEETAETAIMAPRPDVGHSVTFSEPSPLGTVHLTMRHEPQSGKIIDVFIAASKGDLSADAEALGRLISMILRWPNNSRVNQQTRLELIRNQLIDILGRGQVGLGPTAKRSLPDTVAKIIDKYLAGDFPTANIPFGLQQMKEIFDELKHYGGDLEDIERLEKYVLYGETNGQTEQDAEDYKQKMEREVTQAEAKGIKLPYDLCPDCGNGTLVSIPGKCPYCRTCGFSQC